MNPGNNNTALSVVRFGDDVTVMERSNGSGPKVRSVVDVELLVAVRSTLAQSHPSVVAELRKHIFRGNDGKKRKLPATPESQSFVELMWILSGCAANETTARIPEIWGDLPIGKRIQPWSRQDNDASVVRGQLLGISARPEPLLEQTVPAWLPNFIVAANTLWQNDHPDEEATISWRQADTPLGVTCLAVTALDNSDRATVGPIVSSCAVYLGSPVSSLSRQHDAVRWIHDAFNRLTDAPDLAALCGWQRSGHECIEIGGTLDRWLSRLVGPRAA